MPLWIASGAGSVARQIIGTTVIGGMLAETLIGRLFVPAIFYVAEKFSGAEKRKALPLAPAEAPRYKEPSILRNSSCGRSGSRLHDGPEVQTACRECSSRIPFAGTATSHPSFVAWQRAMVAALSGLRGWLAAVMAKHDKLHGIEEEFGL